MKTTPADGCRDILHTVYQRRSLHGSLMMQKADGGSEETRQVENPGVTESSYSGDTGHTQLLESQEKAQQPALGMSAGRAAAGPGGQRDRVRGRLLRPQTSPCDSKTPSEPELTRVPSFGRSVVLLLWHWVVL